MILIGFHVTLLTLNVSLLEQRILSQCMLAIAHTMTLQITLGSQVESVFVAEVVPTWIIRIVAGTYSVDVQLLHNLDILNHTVNRYNVTTIRIQFVAVGTLNQNRLSVHQQLSALNLNVAETYTLFDYLGSLSTLLHGNLECI